jgi:hypothetical protein
MSDKPEVLVICDGNQARTVAIRNMVNKLDQVMLVDAIEKPVEYIIKALPRMSELLINIKKDGDYRQFEKRDKRKNFKK